MVINSYLEFARDNMQPSRVFSNELSRVIRDEYWLDFVRTKINESLFLYNLVLISTLGRRLSTMNLSMCMSS